MRGEKAFFCINPRFSHKKETYTHKYKEKHLKKNNVFPIQLGKIQAM